MAPDLSSTTILRQGRCLPHGISSFSQTFPTDCQHPSLSRLFPPLLCCVRGRLWNLPHCNQSQYNPHEREHESEELMNHHRENCEQSHQSTIGTSIILSWMRKTMMKHTMHTLQLSIKPPWDQMTQTPFKRPRPLLTGLNRRKQSASSLINSNSSELGN